MDTNPSLVTGIFRHQSNADRAMLDLQDAGFSADQIKANGYNLNAVQEVYNSVEVMSDNIWIIVTVGAENRTKEAANILVNNGANNSDLPAGIVLNEGIPVRVKAS